VTALRYLPFARRAFVRRGPALHLTLFVTGACNLRCRHCFHWKEVAAGVPGPPLEDIRKLADSAARMGPLLWVSFGGGEPFLRADLPELARAFGRHGLRHLAIPTNGLVERQHASLERMLDENPETFVSVAVSFDGPPAIHDAIRQIPGGHARALAAVRRLKQQQAGRTNLGVGVILTVTKANQEVLASHVEELVDALDPDNVTINLARDDALDRELLDVDLDRYREVVATRTRLRREGKLRHFDFPLARLASARDQLVAEHVERVARGDDSAHLPCTAGSLSAVVFEDGRLAPCEILDAPLGNLNDVDWDLERLWNAPEAEAVRRCIRKTRCSCTWECAQGDNVLFQPRSWPRLARTVVLT